MDNVESTPLVRDSKIPAPTPSYPIISSPILAYPVLAAPTGIPSKVLKRH